MHTKRIGARVVEVVEEALDVRRFRLKPEDIPLPSFSPGAHINVHISEGVVRQYSICNGPEERDHFVIAVQREAAGRGGSLRLYDQTREGDLVTIGPPRNNFPLTAGAGHRIFLGGGIGITPLLCMARHLAAGSESFELHYCVRESERVAFRDILSAPALRNHVHLHVDGGPSDQLLNLDALLGNRRDDWHLYYCGPVGFMQAVERAAGSRWPPNAVYKECFSAGASSEDDRPFLLELARSRIVIEVPADCTALDALLAHGIDVPSGCEQGVCGMCVTRVLHGVVDHRDAFLSEDDKHCSDKFMPCCSRAIESRLVIDL